MLLTNATTVDDAIRFVKGRNKKYNLTIMEEESDAADSTVTHEVF